MHAFADDLVRTGAAALLPLSITSAFVETLNRRAWSGASRLDWTRLQPFTTIRCWADSRDILAWAQASELGVHSHLGFCFSRKEPCVLVAFEAAILDLDAMFHGTGGICFCFAVDVVDGLPVPHFDTLLQVGDDLLIASARKSLPAGVSP